MKTKFFVALLSIGLAFIVLSGCQKAPQAEVDLALAAVDSARGVEADRYLNAEFLAIQDSLNAAMVGIEEQNSKSAFGRDYNESKRLLVTVKEKSDALISQTQIRKNELKAQNEVLINEVTTLLEEGKALVVKAPKGKEGKAALELIQQDIVVIESALYESSSLISSGDDLSAYDKLSAAKEKAVAINAELNAAIAKAKGIR